jgi:hypothetical protein
MNADMLNRGTEDLSLSLSLFRGGERPVRPPLDIDLLVYLITFDILKQSKINQKTK